ncbi:MAG: fibro-slime domain-containing protein [Planctomycetota bacterium]
MRRATTIGVIAAAGLSGSASAQATIDIPVTIRDFMSSHPDFELGVLTIFPFLQQSVQGAVANTIGVDRKPVFTGGGLPLFSNAANFNQWYNDTQGVNLPIQQTLTFTETGVGTNLFQFSDDSFFPINGQGFGNEGNPVNQHFTMELHTTFTYQGGETFDFTGDDDLWLFINDELVIDLGGIHQPLSASVNLDTLGLVIGETYTFDLFFAERHTVMSNFMAETTIRLDIPGPGSGVLAGLGGLVACRRRRG